MSRFVRGVDADWTLVGVHRWPRGLAWTGQDLDEVLAVLGKSLLEVQQLVEELACQPGEVREGTEASYELDIVGKAGAAGLEAGLLEQEPVLPSLAAGGSGSRVPAGSQPPPRLTKKQREIIELGLRLHRDSFVAL